MYMSWHFASWGACIMFYGSRVTWPYLCILCTPHKPFFFLEDQQKQEFAVSLHQHINCVGFSVHFLRWLCETAPCGMWISCMSAELHPSPWDYGGLAITTSSPVQWAAASAITWLVESLHTSKPQDKVDFHLVREVDACHNLYCWW